MRARKLFLRVKNSKVQTDLNKITLRIAIAFVTNIIIRLKTKDKCKMKSVINKNKKT